MSFDLKAYRGMCRQWTKVHGGRVPDAFARYELPYDVSDPETITRALEEKYRLWQMDRGKNPMFLCFVGEHQGLRAALQEPQDRQQLASRLSAQDAAVRQRNAARVHEHLTRIHARRDFLTPAEFSNLARALGDLGLETDELRVRLEIPVRSGPTIANNTNGAKGGPSPALMKEMDEALAMFDHSTLYEFLGLAPTAPHPEMEERSQELKKVWNARPRDDKNTYAQKILGMIETHLLAQEGERRPLYDQSLETYRLGKVLDLELDLLALSGRITYDERQQLVERATAAGVGLKGAQNYIKEKAAGLGVEVERAWSRIVSSWMILSISAGLGVLGVGVMVATGGMVGTVLGAALSGAGISAMIHTGPRWGKKQRRLALVEAVGKGLVTGAIVGLLVDADALLLAWE